MALRHQRKKRLEVPADLFFIDVARKQRNIKAALNGNVLSPMSLLGFAVPI
jgi:hypothetical protein